MIETAAARRRELLDLYLQSLPFEPYPFQRDALEAWYSSGEDLLVTAPTGTGKTLIAEGALFEALHGGRTAYYTTPLIALTEQKFREMQAAAVRWGFPSHSVGLVTGNRQVNPDARLRVVVAEILLNRLLRPGKFDFDRVAVVVKDEFHTFRDPERGIVWELSLSLLPKHVRLLLLSATVGRPESFTGWLRKSHGRKLQLLQGRERRVPLTYQWVGDLLLEDLLVKLVRGGKKGRRSPCLVFCFNRRECWSVAERLKGRPLVDGRRKRTLAARLREMDLSDGAGPLLRQLLLRGVGIHHAGILPKYRRVVEKLFQRRLLPVVICTETLSAGINLPARSVVLSSLVKGPPPAEAGAGRHHRSPDLRPGRPAPMGSPGFRPGRGSGGAGEDPAPPPEVGCDPRPHAQVLFSPGSKVPGQKNEIPQAKPALLGPGSVSPAGGRAAGAPGQPWAAAMAVPGVPVEAFSPGGRGPENGPQASAQHPSREEGPTNPE